MAHDQMSIDEAAEHLKITTRAVYGHIQRGNIHRATSRGCVHSADVERVRRVRSGDSVETVDPGLRLTAHIRKLEAKVELHSRVLGLYREPLNLTTSELVLFQQACASYSQLGWSPFIEPTYADAFERLRLEDLEALAGSTGDEHPWASIYRFSLTMFHAPFDKSLRDQLCAGKQNLYQLATLWCHMRGVKPKSAEVLARKAQPDGRVLRKFHDHGEDSLDDGVGQ